VYYKCLYNLDNGICNQHLDVLKEEAGASSTTVVVYVVYTDICVLVFYVYHNVTNRIKILLRSIFYILLRTPLLVKC